MVCAGGIRASALCDYVFVCIYSLQFFYLCVRVCVCVCTCLRDEGRRWLIPMNHRACGRVVLTNLGDASRNRLARRRQTAVSGDFECATSVCVYMGTPYRRE